MGGCDSDEGCSIRKQPATPEEVDAAIRAMVVSCIEAYRYGGKDTEILRRLAEIGYESLCDHPLVGCPRVDRNCACFTFSPVSDARELAEQLAGWLHRSGGCGRTIVGNAVEASFGFTPWPEGWGEDRFTLTKLARASWLVSGPPKKIGYSIQMHDVLRANEARNLRWYSRDEWDAGLPGQSTPF